MKAPLLLLLAAGCALEPPIAESEEALTSFDFNRFKGSVEKQVTGKVTGYAFTVYKWGTVLGWGAGGNAVLKDNLLAPNDVPHSPTRTQDCFSMTKTISAAAMLKAIEEKGGALDVFSKITNYLPSDWIRGPHVSEMTFRDVMTHSTGLDDVGGIGTVCSYGALRQMVKNGATDARFHKLKYSNASFCLLRILVPYVVLGPAFMVPFEQAGPNFVDSETGSVYVSYAKAKLFEPLGISADVVPSGPQPFTRYYNFNDTTKWQADPLAPFPITDTGASYWNLSSDEFARFIDGLFGWRILSSAMVNVMINTTTPDPAPWLQHTRLGMWKQEDGSPWYKHNGGPGLVNGSGASTVWFRFPEGISVALYINSIGGMDAANNLVVAEPVVVRAYKDATGAL